ncbi:hypothetical protein VOLCADRAFT_98953 [Volvox carteri f. nagariensis]|uniref:Uncharacterized protein n=1 Tax=Volvox carteri f. nagariensis TaxID=3068 RepID=D8UGP7_VOLCA|nr:uncharacterized protein VOLCADRAFT_98953 [Volvox carteri f. nagariensis]EFJ41067.1 hypothetical protein VOLCADRAFT_98953 [Volvox carteri f. nagariensis]|eukprot:XP_002957830.1 hypothetical protein VOLCADRAFT_98953 [Volvox carteri f. nagariensis]
MHRRVVLAELIGAPAHVLGSSIREQTLYRVRHARERRQRTETSYRPALRASATSALTVHGGTLNTCNGHIATAATATPTATSPSAAAVPPPTDFLLHAANAGPTPPSVATANRAVVCSLPRPYDSAPIRRRDLAQVEGARALGPSDAVTAATSLLALSIGGHPTGEFARKLCQSTECAVLEGVQAASDIPAYRMASRLRWRRRQALAGGAVLAPVQACRAGGDGKVTTAGCLEARLPLLPRDEGEEEELMARKSQQKHKQREEEVEGEIEESCADSPPVVSLLSAAGRPPLPYPELTALSIAKAELRSPEPLHPLPPSSHCTASTRRLRSPGACWGRLASWRPAGATAVPAAAAGGGRPGARCLPGHLGNNNNNRGIRALVLLVVLVLVLVVLVVAVVAVTQMAQ